MTAADRTTSGVIEWPAPWWYRLLAWLWPSRCREIPEANNPDRLVLRQFAIVKRYAYLQQFASAEDPRFMHSHPYRFMLAIGLWGGYLERRIAGAPRRRRAPYLYTLDGGHVHHVQEPTRGHTSIFVGIGRAEDDTEGDKRYFGTPSLATHPLLESASESIRCAAEYAVEEMHEDREEFDGDFETAARLLEPPPMTIARSWRDHIKVKVARI